MISTSYSDDLLGKERVQNDREVVLALLAASAIMMRAQKLWMLSVGGPRDDTLYEVEKCLTPTSGDGKSLLALIMEFELLK